ncbi:hypothetical protein [Ruegeria sp. EL01]|jgi:hypothetical protein|uniref:hypothetical protein n=1 Tax=Ruegeria sp. EL01 TaxID=2107578 RepID=UPI000EA81AAC|nr:hypothetical protein [Ruegeria sp. EL01]
MDKLEPIFKSLPIALLVYGFARTLGECFEVSMSGSGMAIIGDTEWEMRMLLYIGYMRAMDSLFFYAAMAAVVHWLNVRSRGAAA